MTSLPESPPPAHRPLGSLVFISIAALILLWPLAYNGAPLLMGDSGGYLLDAFDHTVHALRPSFYPYWVACLCHSGMLAAVCAGQALLLAIVLSIVLGRVCRLILWPSLAVLATLALTTTAAWWTSMIMSDIFFGIAALAACALALKSPRLSLRERSILWIAAGLSLFMHIAMPPAMLGFSALIMLAGLRQRRQWLVGGALAVLSIAALGAYPLLNALSGHGYQASTETFKFLVSRMTADGTLSQSEFTRYAAGAPDRQADLTARYLQVMQQTPRTHPEFPSATATRNGIFLHDPSSPFDAWESDIRLPTFKQMVLETCRRRPLPALSAIAFGTARLLGMAELPAAIEGFAQQTDALSLPLKDHLPDDFTRYRNSREAQATLHLGAWNVLIGSVYKICALALIPLAVTLWLLRRQFYPNRPGTSPAFTFALLLTAFVVIHAGWVYTLSGDFPRYQSRMSWMIVLATLLLSLDLISYCTGKIIDSDISSPQSPPAQAT